MNIQVTILVISLPKYNQEFIYTYIMNSWYNYSDHSVSINLNNACVCIVTCAQEIQLLSFPSPSAHLFSQRQLYNHKAVFIVIIQ